MTGSLHSGIAASIPRTALDLFLRNHANGIPKSLRHLETKQRDSFLPNVESLASNLLLESGAISTSQVNPVSLRKLASFLGCDLHLTKSRFQSLGQFRASVTLDSCNRWHINAGDPTLERTREAVAHELGHILLYSPSGKPERHLWKERQWTLLEEWLASYLARFLLMPNRLLIEPPPDANIAEYIVLELQRRFKTGQETAGFRWLDLKWDDAYKTIAVSIWRQYHPFSPRFLTNVAWRESETESNAKKLSKLVKRTEQELTMLERRTSWNEAAVSWKLLFEDCEALQSAALRSIGEAFLSSDRVTRDKLKQRLAIDLVGGSFYPQAIIYRIPPPQGSYTPVRRGALRIGSQAHKLATGSPPLINDERLNIGYLRGYFLCHGFAHGVAETGNRFIIQVQLEK